MNNYRNKAAKCAILTASRSMNQHFKRNGHVPTCIRPNLNNAAANNCAAALHPNHPNQQSFPASAAQHTQLPNHMLATDVAFKTRIASGTTVRNFSTKNVAFGNNTTPGLDDTTTCQTNTS